MLINSGCKPISTNEPQADFNRRQLTSPKQAAHRLGTTEGTLAKWRCAGVGVAYVKIGGRVYYELSVLNAYIDGCTVKPPRTRAG
jgi:hypothetical protein